MKASTLSITQERRYQQRIRKLEGLWNLEGASHTRWLMSMPSGGIPLGRENISFSRFFQDKSMQLDEQLRAIEWAEGLEIDDLYVPHLQPQAGVTIFASAFGCLIDFPENMYPRSHFAIKDFHPAEKVHELPHPSIMEGQLGDMLEFTDYFVKETGGRYPIQMTDIQSPVDTAYLIWDSSKFMAAMYKHPNEVHHLMRLVTDLTIAFIKEHRARSPEFIPMHYPAVWYPDGMGVAISDDALAVLSPKTYEEFALPYANELSEEFNGLVVHSCGNFIHQFKNLKKIHKLRGINFGASETPFEAVWENFNGETAIVPHMGLNKDIHFDTQLDYIQHILEVKTHNQGLLILVDPRKFCDGDLSVPMARQYSEQIIALVEQDALN